MLVCVKKWQAVISCQHSWLSCCVWCDLICVWSELLVLQVYIVIGVRRKISYLNAGVKSSSSSCLEPWLEPSKSGFSETYHTCLLTLLRFVRSLGAPVRKDSFDRNTLFSPPPALHPPPPTPPCCENRFCFSADPCNWIWKEYTFSRNHVLCSADQNFPLSYQIFWGNLPKLHLDSTLWYFAVVSCIWSSHNDVAWWV